MFWQGPMAVSGRLGVQEEAVLAAWPTTALLVAIEAVSRQSSIENELGSGAFVSIQGGSSHFTAAKAVSAAAMAAAMTAAMMQP